MAAVMSVELVVVKTGFLILEMAIMISVKHLAINTS
jgi:hypothetical protein